MQLGLFGINMGTVQHAGCIGAGGAGRRGRGV